jgi:hypothetical protein
MVSVKSIVASVVISSELPSEVGDQGLNLGHSLEACVVSFDVWIYIHEMSMTTDRPWRVSGVLSLQLSAVMIATGMSSQSLKS